jgi:hypothetical protein
MVDGDGCHYPIGIRAKTETRLCENHEGDLAQEGDHYRSGYIGG